MTKTAYLSQKDTTNSARDIFVHRLFRVPYTLHVQDLRSPKNPKDTIVLLHGLGNSSGAWNETVKKLPDDVRIIGIDLLGFGNSPKPLWASYKISTQAYAVAKTLVRQKLKHRPIIIGHSLGSLIAIDLARNYPIFIKKLILCSPPIYKSTQNNSARNRDYLLREFFKTMKAFPNEIDKITPMAKKLGIANKTFSISGNTSKAYAKTLEASILHQSSMRDLERIKTPTSIIYGLMDPVVIGKNLRIACARNENIKIMPVMAGHEITTKYIDLITKELG